jgi:hypothetical protein
LEDDDGLMKSKSAPILTSTTSKPKRKSPLPPTTSQTAGGYSNLRTLTPILSSDSIDDETLQPRDVNEGRMSPIPKIDQRRSKEPPAPVDNTSHVTDNLIAASDPCGAPIGDEQRIQKEKLLVSQKSSDTFITPRPSQSKPKASFCCCMSSSSTTDAVIRGEAVQPPIHDTPPKGSATKRKSKTGKKSESKHQEMNTSRGKSGNPNPRSIDASMGKSSSHGKKPKPSSGNSLSEGSSHGGSQHGVNVKKNPGGEAKPSWLN